MAQKSIVKPSRNGTILWSSAEFGALATSVVPASVEIAIAPMLIQ